MSRPKAAPILLILSGLAFGLLGRFEYDSIREGASNQCCDFATFYVGAGIWWIYAGAAATFLAGLVLIGQMRASGVARPAAQGSPAVFPPADQMT